MTEPRTPRSLCMRCCSAAAVQACRRGSLQAAISPNGETLFFTSTRDGGFGLNDIYVTTRTKHLTKNGNED